MQTLTYGMQVPSTGDKGSIFWEALEENATLADGHTHNGTNSALLPTLSLTPLAQSISSASWAAVSGKTGLLSQQVTMTSGIYANRMITFRNTSGDPLFLQTAASTASDAFIVYINSSINVTAYYGV